MTTTILIIDDNEDDQRLYQHAFRAYKDFDSFFNLMTALSAEAGFAQLAETQPDLILLDYNLPDMDGISFIKRLAATSAARIPVVMLTGESSPEKAAEMIKSGAEDYLTKDTGGQYLRRLPGICKRVVAAHAQKEMIQRIKQEADDKFRLLFDLASDCLLLLSPDGRIRDINRVGYERLGYSKGEMLGASIREFTTPEFAAGVQSRTAKIMREGQAVFESVYVRKDGSTMPVEVNSRLIELHGEKILYGIIRDITERKKAEALLEQHKLVIDTSLDGFWMCDMQGMLLEANEAYAAMSGYTLGELAGMHVNQLEATQHKAEEVLAHIVNLLAQGCDRFETRHRRKDGREFDVEVSVRYLAEPGRLFVFCRDITERKLAQFKLDHKQALLNAAQRLAKLASWELDLLSGELSWSDEMYRILELDPALHLPSYENFLDALPPDDRARVDQAYEQSLLDRQPYDVVHRLLFADGRVKWLREHCTSEFDAAGLPLRSMGMTQDITAQIEAEAALRQSAANQRAMLDNSPYLTWLKDSEGRYITVNKVFAEYLRLEDARQIEGKTDHGLWPGELAEKIRADDAEVLLTRQRKQQEEPVPDGGQVFWIESYRTPIIDEHGNVLGTAGFARDVTKRKRAQLETEALLRRNQALMQTSQDGIHVLDMRGNVVDVNEAFCRMLGYSREEALQRNVTDWDAQWSAEELLEQFRGLVGRSSLVETVHRRRDGALLDVEISVTGVEIDGQALLFCASRDVSARKQAEKQLRWENKTERKRAEIVTQQFGSLLQGSFNEIYIFDASSLHFLLTSKGAKINLGYSSEELYYLTPLDLAPTFTRESFERMLAPLRSGEQTLLFLETTQRRKDGTTYPVEVRLQLMNGGPSMFLAIVQDVTERRLAEDALRQSSAEIEDLYEHAPCGYHSLDSDGIIRIINNTELVWLGYTREEVVGKFRLAYLLTPDSMQTFQQTFPHLKASGAIQDLELDMIRKDGTILPVLISATALYDKDGNFVMSRSTVYDMSERKKLEQERVEFLKQLERVSHNLVATQEDTRRRLSRELHDRTSPNLAAIQLNLDVIGRSLSRESSADLAESLEDARALIADTTASIRDICTEMRPPLLDYAGLFAAMEGYIQQFARRTGLAVRLDCDNREVRYSPQLESLLFRIFQEALTNCAKHAGAASASVTLNGGSGVTLTISDDGVGFDPAQLGKAGQVGFGLLNMREMAEVAGGRLFVESSAGNGTRIAVEIA